MPTDRTARTDDARRDGAHADAAPDACVGCLLKLLLGYEPEEH
jgi:hypothetical protein